jgi:nitrogen fixation NifU-like protein
MLDAARDLYGDTILDRGRHPRHARRLDLFDADARAVNTLCGDRCHVFVRRAPDGRVADIGFEARGCAISVASADLMAESVRGLDATGARDLRKAVELLARTGDPGDGGAAAGTANAGGAPDTLRALAGLQAYPSRIKCAMLPWDALLAALHGGEEHSDE